MRAVLVLEPELVLGPNWGLVALVITPSVSKFSSNFVRILCDRRTKFVPKVPL